MAATISIKPTAALTDGCSAVCPSYYSGTGSYSSSPSAGKFAFTNYQFTATATTGWRVKRVIFHTSWDASDGSSGTRKYTFRNSDNVNPYVIPETQKYTQEWPYDFRETDPGDEWRLRTTLETITDIEVLFEVGPTPPPSVKVVSAHASPSDGGTVQVGSDDSGTSSSYAVEIGGSVNIVATPASSWIFSGWFKNNVLVSSNTTYTVSNVTADQSFEARFTPVYTITATAYWLGKVSINGGTPDIQASGTFNPGDVVTLDAYSDDDYLYYFDRWILGSDYEHAPGIPDADAHYQITVTASQSYGAVFKIYPLWEFYATTRGIDGASSYGATITVNGGTPTDRVYGMMVRVGDSLVLSASQTGTFQEDRFVKWVLSEDSTETVISTSPYFTFTPSNPQEGSTYHLIAYYGLFRNITISTTPDGSGSATISPAASDGWYQDGTQIVINATPSTGWRFVKWTRKRMSGGNEYEVSSLAEYTFKADDSWEYKAYFEYDGTNLLVNSSDLGSPVQLVYDDRSGGTGLLVADY